MKHETLLLTVQESRKIFEELVTIAEELESHGKIVAAATCARMSAQVAWRCHAGLFASPRLERLLLRLGKGILSGPNISKREPKCEQVVHVLTNATSTSGDTRFVRRWILIDSSVRHSVVMTRQAGKPVPIEIEDAVSNSGGKIYVLDSSTSDPIQNALALRKISTNAKAVFLHNYPDDVVPTLAFAEESDLPVVAAVNQSDHTFWIGVSVADLVVELRDIGHDLSRCGRGIPSGRTAFLPIPIIDFPKYRDRTQSKAKIGLSNKKILLSIAVGLKYTPLLRPSWQDLILEILDRVPDAVCIVIGPKASDLEWRRACERCPGRLVLIGPTSDTKIYYEAADIYLDSYPFASNTSLIEAGIHGMPLVGFYPHKSYASVLCGGAIGLNGVLVEETEPAEYVGKVVLLLQSENDRRILGDRTRESLVNLHGPEGWRRSLSKVYTRLSELEMKPRDPITVDIECSVDSRLHNLLHYLYVSSGQYISISGMAEMLVNKLPYRERFQLVRRLRKLDQTTSRELMLPNCIRRTVEFVRSIKSPML